MAKDINAILRAQSLVQQARAENEAKGIKSLKQRNEEALQQEQQRVENLSRIRQENFAGPLATDTRDGGWRRAKQSAEKGLAGYTGSAVTAIPRYTPGVGQQSLDDVAISALNKQEKLKQFEEKFRTDEDFQRRVLGKLSEEYDNDPQLQEMYKTRNEYIAENMRRERARYELTEEEKRILGEEAVFDPAKELGNVAQGIGKLNDLFRDIPGIGNLVADYSPLGFATKKAGEYGEAVEDIYSKADTRNLAGIGLGESVSEIADRRLRLDKTAEVLQDGERAAAFFEQSNWLKPWKGMSDDARRNFWETPENIGRKDLTNTAYEYYEREYAEKLEKRRPTNTEDEGLNAKNAMLNALSLYKRSPTLLASDAGESSAFFIPGVGSALIAGNVAGNMRESERNLLSKTQHGLYGENFLQDSFLSVDDSNRVLAGGIADMAVQYGGQKLLNKATFGKGLGDVAGKLTAGTTSKVSQKIAGTAVDKALTAVGDFATRTAPRRALTGATKFGVGVGGRVLGDGIVEGLQEVAEAKVGAFREGRDLTGAEAGQSFASGLAVGSAYAGAGNAVAGVGRTIDSSRTAFSDSRLKKLDNATLMDPTDAKTFRPDLVIEKNAKALKKDMSFEQMQVIKQETEMASFLMQDQANYLRQEKQRHTDINAEMDGIKRTLDAGNLEPETEAALERQLNRLQKEKNTLTSEKVIDRSLPEVENRQRKAEAQARRTDYKANQYAASNNKAMLEGWDGATFESIETPEFRTLESPDIYDIDSNTESDRAVIESLGVDPDLFNPESEAYDPVKGAEELNSKITAESPIEQVESASRMASLHTASLEQSVTKHDTAKSERAAIRRSNKVRIEENARLREELKDPNITPERKAEIQAKLKTNAQITANLAKRDNELKQQVTETQYAKENLQAAKEEETALKTRAAALRAENKAESDSTKTRISELEEKIADVETREIAAKEAGNTEEAADLKKSREDYQNQLADERKKLIRLIGARKNDKARGDLKARKKQLSKDRDLLKEKKAELDEGNELLTEFQMELDHRDQITVDFVERVRAGQDPVEVAADLGIPYDPSVMSLETALEQFAQDTTELRELIAELEEDVLGRQEVYDEAKQIYDDDVADFGDDIAYTEASLGEKRDAAQNTVEESQKNLKFTKDTKGKIEKDIKAQEDKVKETKGLIDDFTDLASRLKDKTKLKELIKSYGFNKFYKAGDTFNDVADKAKKALLDPEVTRLEDLKNKLRETDSQINELETRLEGETATSKSEEEVLRETKKDTSVDEAVDKHEKSTKALEKAIKLHDSILELNESIDAIKDNLDELDDTERTSAEEDIKVLEEQRKTKEEELSKLDMDSLKQDISEQEAIIEEAVKDGIKDKGLLNRARRILKAGREAAAKATNAVNKVTESRKVSNVTDKLLNIRVNKVNLEDDDPVVTKLRKILGSADIEDFELDLTEEQYKSLLDSLRVLEENVLLDTAGNKLEDVSSNIREGRYRDDGTLAFWGMQQYLEEVTKGIAANDPKQVRRLIGQLKRFSNDQNAKVAAVNNAYGQFDGDMQYVLKDKKGNWFNATAPQLAEQGYDTSDIDGLLKKTGGLYINDKSGRLVEDMAIDADFVSDTLGNLQSAANAFFKGKTPKTPTGNQNQDTGGTGGSGKLRITPLTAEDKAELGHFSKRFNQADGKPLFTVIHPKNAEGEADLSGYTSTKDLDVDNYDATNHYMYRPEGSRNGVQSEYVTDPRAQTEFNRWPYTDKDGNQKYGRAAFGSFIKAETNMLTGANKYIGFGSRPWEGDPFDPSIPVDKLSDNDLKTLYKSDEGRIRAGFGGNANVLTSKGEEYRPEDVVAYHRDNDYNDSREISYARKQELDAALAKGATILTKPDRGGHSNNRIKDDIQYMLNNAPHAYVEAAAKNSKTAGSGVFYKVPTTPEEAAIVDQALARLTNAKRADESKEQQALAKHNKKPEEDENQNQDPNQDQDPNQNTNQEDEDIYSGFDGFDEEGDGPPTDTDPASVKQSVLEYVEYAGRPVTASEISSDIGLGVNEVTTALDSLVTDNVLEKTTTGAYQLKPNNKEKSVDEYKHDWQNYFNNNPDKLNTYAEAIKEHGNARDKYKFTHKDLEPIAQISDNSFEALKQVVTDLADKGAVEYNNSFNNLIPTEGKQILESGIFNGVEESSWQPVAMRPVTKEIFTTSGKMDLGKNAGKLRQKDTVLNSEPEFFNKILAAKDEVEIAKLANIPALKRVNREQLDSFIRLHNKMHSDLDIVVRNPKHSEKLRKNPIYEYLIVPARDDMGNIITNNRGDTVYTIDENVFTATVLGMFKYIQQQGHNPYLDAKGVNIIHGIDKNLRLHQQGMLELSKYGGHRNQVFQDIGKTAVQALGLRAGRNVPEHIIEQIEAGLGAVAFHLVQDNNPNPFFVEKQMTHREQLGKLIDAMEAKDFKKHLINLNKKTAGGKFFYTDPSTEKAFKKAVRTKDDLREFLGLPRRYKKRQRKDDAKFYPSDIHKVRAEEYLDTSINLARVTIDRDWDKEAKKVVTTYNPEVLDILKSSERTRDDLGPDLSKDLLNEIFSVDGGRIAPRSEPIKSLNQLTVKKSDTGIPANMEESLVKAAQQPWIVQKDRADFLIKMYDDPLMREKFYNLMGVVSDEELNMMHPERRELRMADNAIKREMLDDQITYLKSIKDIKTGEYAEFFQVPVVWVNQRVGYESTLFNAQTDLFARTLSGMKNWEAEVDPTQENITKDKDGKEKLTIKGRFLIALAENMEGLSKGKNPKLKFDSYNEAAQTVDKVKASDFLEQFENYLETDADFLAAVEIIQDSFENEENIIQGSEFAAIQKVMDDFGMDELGFGVLVEYAKYDLAKQNGEKHTTFMGAQSDGVTNGPIITKMLLGEATRKIRRMGGILGSTDVLANGEVDYFDTKKVDGVWTDDIKDDPTLDLYQATGLAMKQERDTYLDTELGGHISSVLENPNEDRGLNIVGNFGSRKWAKTLTTPFNYGAGIESLRKAISQDMFEAFQKEYYAIYETTDPEARQAQMNRVNRFLADVAGQWNTIFVHPTDGQGNSLITADEVEYQASILALIHNQGEQDLRNHVSSGGPMLLNDLRLKYDYLSKENPSNLDFITKLSNQLRKDSPITADRIPTIHQENFAEPISNNIEKWIKEIAEVSYGTAATRSIQRQEAMYIEKRNALNKVAEHAYKNFALLKDVVTKMEAKDPNNLTKAERKRIDAIIGPSMAAVASGLSNLGYTEEGGRRDTIKNGINLLAPITQVTSGQQIRLGDRKFTSKGSSSTLYNYSYAYRTTTEPGVRSLALMIQSIDSAVSVLALSGDYAGMNFHDANVFGLKDFEEGVKAQNENFFKILMNYEPAREMAKAYTRPLYKLEQLMKDPKTPKSIKDIIKSDINSRTAADDRNSVTPGTLYDLMQLDVEKYLDTGLVDEKTAQLLNGNGDHTVHQYAGHDGAWIITKRWKQIVANRYADYMGIDPKTGEQVDKPRFHKEAVKAQTLINSILKQDSITPKSIDNKDVVSHHLMDEKAFAPLLKKLLESSNVNVNQITDLFKEHFERDPEAIQEHGLGIYEQLDSLKDVELGKVKVKLTNKKLLTGKKDAHHTTEVPVKFSRFNNTVFINSDSLDSINMKDILKEVLVASLHHNLKPIKNGSRANPDLADQYNTLKVVSQNMPNLIRKALKDGYLVKEEAVLLAETLGSQARKGDVEGMMVTLMHDDTGEISTALAKIPNYFDSKHSTGIAILDAFLNFMSNLFDLAGHENLYKAVKDLTDDLTHSLMSYEDTISARIKESYKRHEHPFKGEHVHAELHGYDTRFHFELAKAKYENKGKPLSVDKVLNVVKQALNSERGDVGFKDTLLPVVEILQQSLKDTKENIILVDSERDIPESVFNSGEIDVDLMIMQGRSFRDPVTNAIYVPTSYATSAQSARISTVVHELVHTLTQEQLSKTRTNAFKNLKSLKEQANEVFHSQNAAYWSAQGFSNEDIAHIGYAVDMVKDTGVDEFFTEVMTNKAVRDFLRKIPKDESLLVGKGLANKDQGFYNIAADALGVTGVDKANALYEFSRVFGEVHSKIDPSFNPNYDLKIDESDLAGTIEQNAAEASPEFTPYTAALANGIGYVVGINKAQDILKNDLTNFVNKDLGKVLIENMDKVRSYLGMRGIQDGDNTNIKLRHNGKTYKVSEAIEYLATNPFGDMASKAAVAVAADEALTGEKARRFLFSPDMEDPVKPQDRVNPRAVFDALGAHSTKDNSHLKGVISGLVNNLMESVPEELVTGYDYEKIWFDHVANDKAVYSSEALNYGFSLDAQQAYVLEVIESAFENSLDSLTNTAAYRQLERAYQQAKKQAKASDFLPGSLHWLDATPEEQEIASKKFHYLFRPAVPVQEKKSPYLINFMALALVDPSVNSVLSKYERKDENQDSDLYLKAIELFKDTVESWDSREAGVSKSASIGAQVTGLTERLGQIYWKNQDELIDQKADLFTRIEDSFIELGEKAVTTTKDAVADLASKSKTPLAKAVHTTLTSDLKDADRFINKVLDDISGPNKTLGDLRETINEVVGTLDNPEHSDGLDLFHAAKSIEIKRGEIVETIGKAIKESYAEQNRDLNAVTDKAVTDVTLRTDIQSLLDDYSFDEVMNFLREPSKLTDEILKLEQDIEGLPYGNEYLLRAKGTAIYMTTRKAVVPHLAKNAMTIVERVGIPGINQELGADRSTYKKVDKIISLYALERTRKGERERVLKLYDSELELNENPMTGLEYTVRSHKTISEEANELFEDNPYSKVKGYLPNVNNPLKGFQVVPEDMVEEYEAKGFVVQGQVVNSLKNYLRPMVLMTTSNTGKQRYVSGVFSVEDTIKSGTATQTYWSDSDTKEEITSANEEAAKKMFRRSYKEFKPSMHDNYEIPSYGSDGAPVAYSYEMSHAAMDAYLDRKNTSSLLLSQLKGANINKKYYPSNNKRTVDYILDTYAEATANRDSYYYEGVRNKFVEVSPEADTARGVELWHSLPRETQLYVEERTGGKVLHVRNDEINLLFGYKKLDTSNIFDKEGYDRNFAEALFGGIFEALFKDKAKLRHNQTVTTWHEAIALLKDYIVIRNYKILVGNIMSNVAFLMVNQTDPKNAIRDIKDALTYSLKYQNDMEKLNKIKHEVKLGINDAATMSTLAELNDAIARNPLADFIEAGMMPLIVNDMSFRKDEVAFDTPLDSLREATIGQLPKGVQTGLDHLLVRPGTPLYSFLANSTQQSDFVFKYAIYQQELRKGASKEDALKLARKVFIDYDVPTNKTIQAMNDNGVFMFSKFSLRIMRVLAYYMKNKPGKMVAEHMVSSELLGNPSLMSLNFIGQIYGGRNMLNMPADDVLTMFGNATPIQLIGNVLK